MPWLRQSSRIPRLAHQSVEVSGDDGPSSTRQRRLDRRGGEPERRRVDVGVAHRAAQPAGGGGRIAAGVRRGDHLVAERAADGRQRQLERVCTAGHAGAVRDAEKRRELFLERGVLRPVDVPAGSDDTLDRALDVVSERGDCSPRVGHRNLRRHRRGVSATGVTAYGGGAARVGPVLELRERGRRQSEAAEEEHQIRTCEHHAHSGSARFSKPALRPEGPGRWGRKRHWDRCYHCARRRTHASAAFYVT